MSKCQWSTRSQGEDKQTQTSVLSKCQWSAWTHARTQTHHLCSLAAQLCRRLGRQRGHIAPGEALRGLGLGQLLHVVSIRGQDDIGGAGEYVRGLVFVFWGWGT